MMRTIEVDVPMTPTTYEMARHLALAIAHDNLIEVPMVVSWHAHKGDAMSPGFEGGDPATWWEKFGAGNHGELEVSVANAYDFVLTDSLGYQTLDEMPLRDLKDSAGNPYICYASLLGESRVPNASACMPADEWLCKQT